MYLIERKDGISVEPKFVELFSHFLKMMQHQNLKYLSSSFRSGILHS